jgi:hypothetical protein
MSICVYLYVYIKKILTDRIYIYIYKYICIYILSVNIFFIYIYTHIYMYIYVCIYILSIFSFNMAFSIVKNVELFLFLLNIPLCVVLCRVVS